MKKVLFILFLVFQLSSILSQETPAETTPACSYTNPLINYIKGKGVTFQKNPKFIQVSSCNEEWKKYGSCCSRDNLSTLVSSHRNAVLDMLKSASDKTSNMEIFSRWFTMIIRICLSTTKQRINGSKSINNKEKTELKDEITYIEKEYLRKLDETSNWISGNHQKNLRSQLHCVKTIASLRTSSICYACSARASIFFTGGKLNMHEDDCRNTISECSEAWLNLLDYITQVSSLHKQVVTISKMLNINFSKFMASSPSTDVADWSAQINLANELLGCRDGLCSFESSKKICDAMISYEQPYYIEKILDIIGKESEGTVSFKTKEEQEKFRQSIIQEFEQAPLEKIIESILENKKARLNQIIRQTSPGTDRTELQGFKPKPFKGGSFNPPRRSNLFPQLTFDSTSVDNTLQQTLTNPLLCQSNEVCVADKVVLSVSECQLDTLRCTSSLFMFP